MAHSSSTMTNELNVYTQSFGVTMRLAEIFVIESFTSPSCTLGVDLRRGRRRFSGTLQLPPLSWRQGERSRTPDEEIMARPTSLPFGAPPRIDITPVDPECVDYR
ncbi:putative cAMP-specific 3'-5'-cyclic phosphodiesterase 4B-like [Scophthalmus maximus]|uniref:Putative cAMP-specific 3'-5'-cyclic phosphodiesterase 4B-like n=1 Tax=Scophthalmus maximus TaxID=52904 RepID=A0A2U9C239_SCOMX|nr:putative cAMP-specific 3'-5'-cyclic phosphodiesterase 4B-like [Scophthalmus maximus]